MASYCKVYSYFKRFSHEEKYKIKLENRVTYFVKVCDAVHFECKQEEYTYETIRVITYSNAEVNSFHKT